MSEQPEAVPKDTIQESGELSTKARNDTKQTNWFAGLPDVWGGISGGWKRLVPVD